MNDWLADRFILTPWWAGYDPLPVNPVGWAGSVTLRNGVSDFAGLLTSFGVTGLRWLRPTPARRSGGSGNFGARGEFAKRPAKGRPSPRDRTYSTTAHDAQASGVVLD